MENTVNNNGYDYVDLGLPSGTLWATCNVGASKPSDAGLYFQWGDTQGYTADQVGIGKGKKQFSIDWIDYYTKEQVGMVKPFTFADYKFCINGSFTNFSKYTTPGETLELEDDAAKILMGGDWHIPTPEQIIELIDNTTTSLTVQDGVKGRLFTSKSDTSKYIFIPAAGNAWDGSVRNSGSLGSVWSSMLSTDYAGYGQYLYFYSGGVYLGGDDRCDGVSVRGVIG